MDKYKYIARDPDSGESEYFDTFEDAENWLKEEALQDGEYSADFCEGSAYIAEITHRSKYIINEKKSEYEDEPWPYGEHESVGEIVFEKVNNEDEKKISNKVNDIERTVSELQRYMAQYGEPRQVIFDDISTALNEIWELKKLIKEQL